MYKNGVRGLQKLNAAKENGIQHQNNNICNEHVEKKNSNFFYTKIFSGIGSLV